MKEYIFFLILTLINCIEEYPKKGNIFILKTDTFQKFIDEHEISMIAFYMPWCIFCRKFEEEFYNAANELSIRNITLAQIDIVEEREISEKFQIDIYPTVKLFYKGIWKNYYGQRRAQEFIDFILNETQSKIEELKSIEEIELYKSKNQLSIIYFGNNKKSFDEYEKVSFIKSNENGLKFAFCNSKDAQKKLGVTDDSIVIFKNFDSGRSEIKNNLTFENINYFIDFYTVPLVMNFDVNANSILYDKKIPCLVLFRNKGYSKIDKIMEKLAKKFQEKKIKFAISIYGNRFSKIFWDIIGIYKDDIPKILILENKDKFNKYLLENEINEENIEDFIKKYLSKNLAIYYKSEKITKDNNKNNEVYKIVGKNFRKDVIETDKDVLVYFYAPWCVQCKKLLVTYKKLADVFKKNKKLLIAQCDGTLNEFEDLKINHYPIIRLWPAQRKNEFIDYGGNRNLEDLANFLKNQATNSLEIPKEDL